MDLSVSVRLQLNLLLLMLQHCDGVYSNSSSLSRNLRLEFDLTEDLEIGDGNPKIAPEPKSEPVNLDFLDEEDGEDEE